MAEAPHDNNCDSNCENGYNNDDMYDNDDNDDNNDNNKKKEHNFCDDPGIICMLLSVYIVCMSLFALDYVLSFYYIILWFKLFVFFDSLALCVDLLYVLSCSCCLS